METISICAGTVQGVAPVIVFRLEDGEQTFYHSTGIEALPHEAERDYVLRDVTGNEKYSNIGNGTAAKNVTSVQHNW